MDAARLLGKVHGWVENKSRELDGVRVEITPETNLLGTGLLDSLAFIELVAFIEEQTCSPLNLMDLDPEEFATIRGLCDAALVSTSE